MGRPMALMLGGCFEKGIVGMADNCLIQDVNGGKIVPKRRDLAGPQPAKNLVSGLSPCPCGGQDLKGVVSRFGMCLECVAKELERQTKAAAYYRAAVLQRDDRSQIPPHVPCRVRLDRRITGDWPVGHMTAAGPGEMDCRANKWGAVSVLADDGKQLGLKLHEFEVVEWAENPAAVPCPC